MAAKTSSDDENDLITDINITPFVDIVLVLLVIFMVTAGIMLEQGINLSLPEAETATALDNPSPLQILISKDGTVYLEGKTIGLDELGAAATAHQKGRPNPIASVSADRGVAYERVVEVLDRLRAAGIADFALQMQKPDKKEQK